MKKNKNNNIYDSKRIFRNCNKEQIVTINYLIGLIACAISHNNLHDLQKHFEMFHVYEIYEDARFKEFLKFKSNSL